MKPHHWPWTFVVFTLLGVICLLAGGVALTGMLKGVHPLFNDEMAEKRHLWLKSPILSA